jgi:hypothetical protein
MVKLPRDPGSEETVDLKRNGTTVMTFPAVADTIVADTALSQTSVYQYTALVQTTTPTGTGNMVTAQTLAPTGHNFTWQTFLLGDGNGSALYDVAIIHDTLAYACGEIYLSGDPLAYNLVACNRDSFELQRIRFNSSCTAVLYPPLRAIWAFSHDRILLTNGGAIATYDGSTSSIDCGVNPLLSGAIGKIFGFNQNDVYVVGGAGSLVRFDGSTWQRLESGTTTRIDDVWE